MISPPVFVFDITSLLARLPLSRRKRAPDSTGNTWARPLHHGLCSVVHSVDTRRGRKELT